MLTLPSNMHTWSLWLPGQLYLHVLLLYPCIPLDAPRAQERTRLPPEGIAQPQGAASEVGMVRKEAKPTDSASCCKHS